MEPFVVCLMFFIVGFCIGRIGGLKTGRKQQSWLIDACRKTLCHECGGLIAPSPCKCEPLPSWDETNADSKALGEFTT